MQRVGDLGGRVDPVGDAEHQHDEVGVDAAGPPAREDQGQGVHAGPGPLLLGVDHPRQRLGVAAHHGRAVGGGDDRTLDDPRVRGEGGVPLVAVVGVARHVDALLLGLLGAGDVPGLEAEPGDDVAQGRLVGRVVEVAAHGVRRRRPRRAPRPPRGTCEQAGLSHSSTVVYSTSISVAPVISSSSSYVVE